MKDKYTVAERNRIVEENLSCINQVLRRSRKWITLVHVDPDDLYQDLALRLILAVDSYRPEAGPLRPYLIHQLEEELQSSIEIQRLLNGENISWKPAF